MNYKPITFVCRSLPSLLEATAYLWPHTREHARGQLVPLAEYDDAAGTISLTFHVRPDVLADVNRSNWTRIQLASLRAEGADAPLIEYHEGRLEMSELALELTKARYAPG